MTERTIDIPGSGGICPPEGMYVLEIIGISDPEQRPGYNEGDTDTQSRVSLKIHNYDYDPNDEDDEDWNGQSIDMFAVWARTNDEGKQSAIYKSPRANSGKLIKAAMNLTDEELKRMDALDLDTLYGKFIQAPVTEKSSGWPKVGDPVAYRRKKAAKPPKTAPPTTIPDDDDDLFEDE